MDISEDAGSEVKMDLSRASDVELRDELDRRAEAKRRDEHEKWIINMRSVAILMNNMPEMMLRAFAPNHNKREKCTDVDRSCNRNNVCMRCVLLSFIRESPDMDIDDVIPFVDPYEGQFLKLSLENRFYKK